MNNLQIENRDSIRVLTLANPPGNTLTLNILKSIQTEIAHAASDKKIRSLVIASNTDHYFSSGIDLDELLSLPLEQRHQPFVTLLETYRCILTCPLPTVAAISGSAILGGWILAMACDWRIMADGYRIALSEIKAGLTPTSILIKRLESLSSNPRVTKEMVLRGQSLNANDAYQSSLVDHVCEITEVNSHAMALAKKLSKLPRNAFAQIKSSRNSPYNDQALWQKSLEEFKCILLNNEATEGLKALKSKRRPTWEEQ